MATFQTGIETVRKVTINGTGQLTNLGYDANGIVTSSIQMRVQFTVQGSMSEALRSAASVIDSNLTENDSLTVTIRHQVDRERKAAFTYSDEALSNGYYEKAR